MSIDCFELISKDKLTGARAGKLHTNHGLIETPVFMPVGTQAAVKGLKCEELKQIGAQVLLGNAYHLNLRPGKEIISLHGGLHQFMGWDRPILTDSGGFQVFSLNSLRKVTDQGVEFKSHIDGSKCFLGAKEVMELQKVFNSDIAMCFDECPPYPMNDIDVKISMERTIEWAKQCREYERPQGQLLFGIVQGGMNKDFRQECAHRLVEMDFDSFALGGLSVGEPEIVMYEVIEWTNRVLPSNKARYLMGCGTPVNLLESIKMGIDMFDCVMPTRNGRNGMAFTAYGPLNIRNQIFKEDLSPLETDCLCYTCRQFSRSYLRHLFIAGEMLGAILFSIHNLSFYIKLMQNAREAILEGNYEYYLDNFKKQYNESKYKNT